MIMILSCKNAKRIASEFTLIIKLIFYWIIYSTYKSYRE